ncbi:MAG: hypothetical protein K0V04_21885 [Deltaproteobacteria bacterium]|nr:hypothetical protein [Deltaproteobacteria bacterium]
MAYSGAPGTNNPMQRVTCPNCGVVPGGANCVGCGTALWQPIVAAFDIGQGSCNALIGADGHVQAFFDFGYSTNGAKQPAPPTRPCLCDQPLIIVSHWDRDHYQLANDMPEAFGLSWIGPRQTVSPMATQFMARIRQAGGNLVLWPFMGVDAVRHMVFPWGWVERGSRPQHDTNGSGLVAYICVRDDPAGVATPARRVSARPGPGAERIAVRRSRKVMRYVWGLAQARRLPMSQRNAVYELALALATVLAASQSHHRRNHMPLRECARAAVSAARQIRLIRGCGAGRVSQQLKAERALPSLRAHNLGWWNTVIGELAAAAVAANPARTIKDKAVAAAGQITRDPNTPVNDWPRVGASAIMGARVERHEIRQGHAPYTPRERFVVVNGDVDYEYAPSMLRSRPPAVVAMTAMHHGSIYDDNHTLGGDRIPWSPDARLARHAVSLADRFRVGGGAGSYIAALATIGISMCRRRASRRRRERIRNAATRAARAATAAIYAHETAYPGQLNPDLGKFCLVAATAAAAAYRHRDPAIVGISATLASTLEHFGGHTGSPHLRSVVELAAKAVSACRRGAPLNADQIREAADGGVDGDLLNHVGTLVHEAVHNGSPRFGPHTAGADAATSHDLLWRHRQRYLGHPWRGRYRVRISLFANDQDVINDLTTGAVAAMLASDRGHYRRHSLRRSAKAAGRAIQANMPNAAIGNVELALRARTQQGYTTAWPPANVNDAARLAGQLAAERVVAWTAGVSLSALRLVTRTALDPAAARIAARTLRSRPHQPSGRIAYSYGVDNANQSHEYRSRVAGYAGHPHPVAVDEYEAHGWVDRRNASHRSAHAGFQGDVDVRHSTGHVALAWDDGNDGPIPPGLVRHACMVCGKHWRFRA